MTRSSDGWHPEKIKAELRIKFGTLKQFAQQCEVAQKTVSEAIVSGAGSSRVELMIADALGVEAHEIWPDRWTKDGQKIDRAEMRRAIAASRRAA